MTRRERLERKLEQREQWAASRKAKAAAAFDSAHREVADIPMGQPILVGHHSEKAYRRALERCDNKMRAGWESENMAAHHASKAAGLQDQLDGTIFSDDDDAEEALEARIAELEAQRDRIKAYNASARKAAKAGQPHGDLDLLDDRQKRYLLSTLKVCPYHQRPGSPFPSYALTNLSANIKRNRDRLEQVKYQKKALELAEQAEGGVLIRSLGRCEYADKENVMIVFAEKPERAVLDALKAAGFHWSRPAWRGYREDIPACIQV